jgi:hypothetical protein
MWFINVNTLEKEEDKRIEKENKKEKMTAVDGPRRGICTGYLTRYKEYLVFSLRACLDHRD